MGSYGKTVKFAIILNTFACMADFFIMSPILNDLFVAFPDANMTLLGMILTISALTIVLSSLLMHKIAKRINLKWIIITGMLMCSIAGAVSGISPTANFMIAMRLIEGFGAGLVIATTPAFVAILWKEERERNQVMGWVGSATAFYGFFLTLGAGFLGAISWHAPFALYLVGIVVAIIDIALLPRIKASAYRNNEEVQHKLTSKPRVTRGVVVVCIEAFVFAVMTSAFFIYISAYVAELAVGGSQLAGAIMSFETVAAFPAGLVLGRMMSKFRRTFAAIAWLLMVVGRGLLQFLGVHFVFGLAAGLIFGLGYGLFYPYIFAKAAEQSDPDSQTLSQGVATSSYYIGTFAATFVVAGVSALFGDFSATFAMHFVFVLCIAMFVISLARGIVGGHKITREKSHAVSKHGNLAL